MKNFVYKLLGASICALTVACGGGKSSSSNGAASNPSAIFLSGTVATGSPVPNAHIAATCGDVTLIGTTTSDGSYTISGAGTLPCTLQTTVTSTGQSLSALVEKNGVANVTPFTEIVKVIANNDITKVAGAKFITKTALKNTLSIDLAESDPVTTPFSTNSKGMDAALDAFNAKAQATFGNNGTPPLTRFTAAFAEACKDGSCASQTSVADKLDLAEINSIEWRYLAESANAVINMEYLISDPLKAKVLKKMTGHFFKAASRKGYLKEVIQYESAKKIKTEFIKNLAKPSKFSDWSVSFVFDFITKAFFDAAKTAILEIDQNVFATAAELQVLAAVKTEAEIAFSCLMSATTDVNCYAVMANWQFVLTASELSIVGDLLLSDGPKMTQEIAKSAEDTYNAAASTAILSEYLTTTAKVKATANAWILQGRTTGQLATAISTLTSDSLTKMANLIDGSRNLISNDLTLFGQFLAYAFGYPSNNYQTSLFESQTGQFEILKRAYEQVEVKCQKLTNSACYALINDGATLSAPVLSSISPVALVADGVTHSINFFGQNFVSGNIVQYQFGLVGGTFQAARFLPIINTSSQLTLDLNPGTVADTLRLRVCRSAVLITDSDCSVEKSIVLTMPMVIPPIVSAPAPTITSISPNPVIGKNGAQSITIFGNGFVSKPNLVLTWNGQSGYSVPSSSVAYINSTQITMTINTTTDADSWSVQVVNPDGQKSQKLSFNVVGTTAPVITGVSPNPVTGSNVQQSILINGSGFAATTSVVLSWTGKNAYALPANQLIFNNSTQLVMKITVGTTKDTWFVKALNPDGTSSNPISFTVK